MERKVKLRRRRKKDTQFRVSSNLCRKIRKDVEKRLLIDNPVDFTAANFLVWLAKKKQITRANCHIDHIKPVCAFNMRCKKERNEANSFYNLRWMESRDNIKKGAKEASQQEINEHLELVGEWINETHYLNKIKFEKNTKI